MSQRIIRTPFLPFLDTLEITIFPLFLTVAFKWGSHSVVSVFIFASLLAARKYGLQSAFWRVYIRHVLKKTQTLSLPFIRACEECLSWVASCLRREHVFCAIILIQEVHKRRLIFPRFFNNLRFSCVVKMAKKTLVLIESFYKDSRRL